VRQRQRTVAAQRFAGGSRIQHDDVEVAVRQHQRQRGADRTGTDDGDVVQHGG
jgi:hypothetical protein